MIIPEEYYKKQIKVELSSAEIDVIIEQLEFANHNIFEYLNLQKIIDKLRPKDTPEPKGEVCKYCGKSKDEHFVWGSGFYCENYVDKNKGKQFITEPKGVENEID